MSHYSTKLFITNAPVDQCLCLYPAEEWNKLNDKVRTKPSSDKHVKFFLRRVIASASEIELDKQGRILIPASLREDAKIQTNIVIVGQVDRIDIWDRTEWDKLVDLSQIDRESMQEGLAALGF